MPKTITMVREFTSGNFSVKETTVTVGSGVPKVTVLVELKQQGFLTLEEAATALQNVVDGLNDLRGS